MAWNASGRVLGGGAILTALLWAACSIYGESLLVPGVADGGDDGNVADAALLEADICAHAHLPPRPAADPPTAADNIEAIVALKSLDFGLRDAGTPVPIYGYDLDNVCTCPGPESCKSNVAAPHCDDEGGRDNSAGALVRRFGSYSSFFDQNGLNQRIGNGLYGFVVRVTGYNGAPDDTEVQVSFYVSNGMDGVQYDGGVPTRPKYDGNDRWTVDPASLFSGGPNGIDCGNDNPACLAKYIDPNAYVAGGVLVASIDSITLSLGNGGGIGSIGVELSGGLVTGTIAPDGNGTYRVTDGLIVGRWATRNLLSQLQILHDPFDTGPDAGFLCGDSGTYQTIKQSICKAADIFSLVAQDNTNAPCDSLSVAVAFEATAAKMGVVATKTLNPANCGPQWHDDCN